MDTHSIYTRQMLMRYGRQLIAARRLAMYGLQAGTEGITEKNSAQRRAQLVERVTQEVMENLVLAGSDNPIVKEVREVLDKQWGEPLFFQYPPAELSIRIFRKAQDDKLEEVSMQEKQEIMNCLWNIIREKVDETML